MGAGEATSYLKDFFVNFENPCEVSLDYLLVHVTSHFAEIFVSEVCTALLAILSKMHTDACLLFSK